MSLSLRAQVLAITAALLVPIGWLLFQASLATREEQRQFVRADAAMAAGLVAQTLTLRPRQEEATVADALRALPSGSLIAVTNARGERLAGSVPPDDRSYLMAQAPLDGNGGMVTAYFLESLAWDRTFPIYKRSYALTVGAAAATVFCIIFFANRWNRALRVLEQQAHRVGAGDRLAAPLPSMPTSEMVSLQQSFSEMERNLISLERQIVRQERLAAIGVLVSGIAHELNNPLQAIAGRAELVVRDPSVSAAARGDLALIQNESARASAIIRNLSQFSRQQQDAPQSIHLHAVVASVVELRQRELQDNGVQLVRDETSRAAFLGVFTEFQQVVLNFVVNAEQALAGLEGPRILTIRTRDRNGAVCCEVEDNGPGVDSADEAKLFEPFFTTKPVGEGTGLGLSVSYGIIKSFGGTIGYRRAANGGAIMWFEVPASQ